MTYRGQHKRVQLPPCPICGRYSGERKQKATEDRYIVICASCGWHTKFYNNKASATKEWQMASKTKEENK